MSRRRKHRSSSDFKFIAWDGEGTQVNEPMQYLDGEAHVYDAVKRPDLDGGVWVRDNLYLSTSPYKAKPQPYVLLANSEGQKISSREGLSTLACFEFLLRAKQMYQESIFVGFGLNYDVNMWVKDLPEKHLEALHDSNETNVEGYYIKWLPRKSFNIKHSKTKRSMIIYDVFGFFQSSFLTACEKYLGKDDPDLEIIRKGKAARDAFTWEELDEFVIPYNDMELNMLVRIMDMVRRDLHGVGVDPSQWHGPGAVANKVLARYNVPISRDIPEVVLDASQFAYAGGRFEQFRVGRYTGAVYEYDIRSAYPSAAAQLPDLSKGYWTPVESFEPGSFGVWRINYRSSSRLDSDSGFRPEPLFCRSETGRISYPPEVYGWYWTPEASFVTDSIEEGWVFRPTTDDRPFAFIEEMFEQRRVFQDQGNALERALKLILNSLYGKLAQTIGGDKGPPRWHQMEYAGYITSVTRAKIYEAILLNPDAIIAAETDAVFTTEPLDLVESKALGGWEKKEYNEITYIQSGFYYAIESDGKIKCRYRGMDADRETKQPVGLPYRTVLDHLANWTGYSDRPTPALLSNTTRFIGLGLGLKTQSVWRSWESNAHSIALNQKPGSGKRVHLNAACPICSQGISMYHALHPTRIDSEGGKSFARSIPWRTVMGLQQSPLDIEEWLEMNPEIRDFAEDMFKWQGE